ncbi:hypothetical protein Q1695_004439 [Nippostrongylus brasiliensis]|nr:hypothetical protein Q1695_004439 [Nippostrongylus brasiliensis]
MSTPLSSYPISLPYAVGAFFRLHGTGGDGRERVEEARETRREHGAERSGQDLTATDLPCGTISDAPASSPPTMLLLPPGL